MLGAFIMLLDFESVLIVGFFLLLIYQFLLMLFVVVVVVIVLPNVVSSNPVHGEVHSIQYYASLLVTYERSVVFSGNSGFLHQKIKLIATI